MKRDNRYSNDVLSEPKASKLRQARSVHAERGMLLEDVTSGFVGEVIGIGKVAGELLLTLEDRHGTQRKFPLGPGYWIDGEPVTVLPPKQVPDKSGPELTASGSIRVKARARTMVPHRILVEGKHDWQLIDKVWGEDLRLEGIAVEELAGVDHLEEVLTEFGPGPDKKVGVLVDHFIPGSKETRIVDDVLSRVGNAHVLVLGHPYVDVWQAIKPGRVGLKEWPHIPKGTDIKQGTLKALGLPHATPADVGKGWSAILARVRGWKDLEPSLLGRVEELIDFLTTEPGA